MRILSHYFVSRFLGLFSTVLAVALLLLATVELVLNLDEVSGLGSGAGLAAGDGGLTGALRYLGLRLTSDYLADVIPIASFVAVFVVFALSGRAMELLAIAAGGIPVVRIVLPVLAAALILSFATALLHETLVLRAARVFAGEGYESGPELDFGREAFWYHRGRTITNVSRADPETRTLHGVEIFERDTRGIVVRVIRADRVRIREDGVWQVEDASVWRFSPDDVRAAPLLQENVSVALDLDTLGGDRLLGADPALLPLRDLARYLERESGQGGEPARTSSALRRLRTRFHERLASPWLVLLFAWLALPFALRVDERGRFARPALAAVAALGLYYLLESAGRTLALEELVPVGFSPWVPMALFAVGSATALALRRRPA